MKGLILFMGASFLVSLGSSGAQDAPSPDSNPVLSSPPPVPQISSESRLRARHILEGTGIIFSGGRFVPTQ
jgi:hypothetical protein